MAAPASSPRHVVAPLASLGNPPNTRRSGSPPSLGDRSPRVRGVAGTSGAGIRPNLPVPKFVNTSANPRHMRKDLCARPENYVSHPVVSLEADIAIVEYDMDEEDASWLERLNSAVLAEGGPQLSEEGFETIVNVCEKHSIVVGKAVACDVAKASLEAGAAPVEDRSVLLEWLSKVHAYWETRRAKLKKPLMRWAPPVPPRPARPITGRTTMGTDNRGNRGAVGRKPNETAQKGQLRGAHGSFRSTELAGKGLPQFDMAFLAKGCSVVLPGVLVQPRQFEAPSNRGPSPSGGPAHADEAAGAPGGVPAEGGNANLMSALQKRLESERKTRVEAERRVQQLSRSGYDHAQTLKRKFESSIDEYERSLTVVENQLEEIGHEEASQRHKFDEEKRRFESERKKHEQERRDRVQRDAEFERAKKKLAKDHLVLLKKLREQEVVQSMMKEQLRQGFQKWCIEQDLTSSVQALLGDCDAILQSYPTYLDEKRELEADILPVARQQLRTMKENIEVDFSAWKDAHLSRYCRPPAKKSKPNSAPTDAQVGQDQPCVETPQLEPKEAILNPMLASVAGEVAPGAVQGSMHVSGDMAPGTLTQIPVATEVRSFPPEGAGTDTESDDNGDEPQAGAVVGGE